MSTFNNMEDNKRLSSVLSDLFNLFNSLKVNEINLPSTSKENLNRIVDEMEKVKDECVVLHEEAVDSEFKRKTTHFFNEINSEILLYKEFLKENNHLDLNEILLLSEEDSKDFPLHPGEIFSSNNSPFYKYNDRHEFSDIQSVNFSLSNFSIQEKNYLQDSPFNWKVLKKLSFHLYDENTRIQVGYPSCLSIGKFIAIGTSRGFVLLYDFKQNLHSVLNGFKNTTSSNDIPMKYSPVTCLSFDSTGNLLAIGHKNGIVNIMDSKNRLIWRTATTSNSCEITHIAFCEESYSFFVSDVEGLVFVIQVPKYLGPYTQSPIFRCSQKVPIFDLKCLPKGRAYPTDLRGIVSYMTFKKVSYFLLFKLFVIYSKPKFELCFRLYNENVDEEKKGCMAWFPCQKLESDDDIQAVSSPMLAYTWGKRINIIRISPNMKPISIGSLTSATEVSSLIWMSSRFLAVFNCNEQFELFDILSLKSMETLDANDRRVIFKDSSYLTHSHSLWNHKGSLFVLGFREISLITLIPWYERLEQISQLSVPDAIQFGIEIYEGTLSKAFGGIPANSELCKASVREFIEKILFIYVESELEIVSSSRDRALSPNGMLRKKAHLTNLVNLTIATFLKVSFDMNLLITFYELLKDMEMNCIFLESVASFILEDKLKVFPPDIMHDLVDYFSSIPDFHESLQQCIMRVDIPLLDLNQVVNVCRSLNLLSALTYVYSQALKDFVWPIKNFIDIIKNTLQNSDNSSLRESCSLIFVFLAFTFSGTSFPFGKPLGGDEKNIIDSCVNFIFYESPENIRILQKFDETEFYKVLGILFDKITGQSYKFTQQGIVDILLDTEHTVPLLCFLCRSLNKYNTIQLGKSFRSTAVKRLCKKGSLECQDAILALISVYSPMAFENYVSDFDLAGFYHVCRTIHDSKRNYIKSVDYILKDELGSSDVFQYIRNLYGNHLTEREKNDMKEYFLKDIARFTSVSPDEVVLLIQNLFPDCARRALESKLNKKTKYDLMKSYFARHSNMFDMTDEYIGLMCEFEPSRVRRFLNKCEVSFTMLEFCKKFKLLEAAVYVFEKLNLSMDAIDYVSEYANCEISTLLNNDVIVAENDINKILDVLKIGIQLCTHKNSESLWFKLFDNFITLINRMSGNEKLITASKRCMDLLLKSMENNVTNLPSLLLKLIALAGSCSFIEYKEVIHHILKTYRHSSNLLRSAQVVMINDLNRVFGKLLAKGKSGILCHVKNILCGICKGKFNLDGGLLGHYTFRKEKDNAIMFPCGHVYHYACIKRSKIESKVNCFSCFNVGLKDKEKEKEVSDEFIRQIQAHDENYAKNQNTKNLLTILESLVNENCIHDPL